MFFLPVFNINYLLYMLPALLLSLIVQFYVNSRYSKWSQVPSRTGLNGAQVAQRLADHMAMYGLSFKGTPGKMTDHYDPRDNTLYLSQGSAQSSSVAAVAITAHEMGHAQQDKEEYLPMRFRSAIVPLVNIGTSVGWIFILLGLMLQISGLAWVGVIAFSAGAVFSIATLPVELNASKRARKMLQSTRIITSENELKGVNQVLNAAALTYVAAIATSVLQLLYFTSLVGGSGRRRR
jgi:Zn-dependent membrane protease YugP